MDYEVQYWKNSYNAAIEDSKKQWTRANALELELMKLKEAIQKEANLQRSLLQSEIDDGSNHSHPQRIRECIAEELERIIRES